jgi:hypothetical protein
VRRRGGVPAAQTSVLHKWVNYTGCDSLYAAAADAKAAYIGRYHAARAAGMPLGGAFLSSHTGLEVAMIAPVEEMTWVRRKLSCAVETAWVILPLASWVAV